MNSVTTENQFFINILITFELSATAIGIVFAIDQMIEQMVDR
jgi:hypothetical protein